MIRTVVNGALLAATILLLSLHWILRSDPARRNFELLPDMAASVAWDSYAQNPNFPDGKTLREPVPGTVIRGAMPLHYTTAKGEAERAGLELTSPFAGDRRVRPRGEFVYTNYCAPCHGPHGKGDGIVAQRGFPAPPSLLAPRAMNMRDGQMFHVVTYGQANMPSYASQIGRDDRWRAIEYVRSLQGIRR
jgi:mono/diheme cytochrome c family protein